MSDLEESDSLLGSDSEIESEYYTENKDYLYIIDPKYYDSIDNKHKLMDFLYKDICCGNYKVELHYYILYKDHTHIILNYIHKTNEMYTHVLLGLLGLLKCIFHSI